jgi:hypothetical protein
VGGAKSAMLFGGSCPRYEKKTPLATGAFFFSVAPGQNLVSCLPRRFLTGPPLRSKCRLTNVDRHFCFMTSSGVEASYLPRRFVSGIPAILPHSDRCGRAGDRVVHSMFFQICPDPTHRFLLSYIPSLSAQEFPISEDKPGDPSLRREN